MNYRNFLFLSQHKIPTSAKQEKKLNKHESIKNKQNNSWVRLDSIDMRLEVPKVFRAALEKDIIAKQNMKASLHLVKSNFYGGLKVQSAKKLKKKE